MLGQQREKRPRRKRPSKLGRIKEPDLARRRREHARQGLKPTGQQPDYFRSLLGAERLAVELAGAAGPLWLTCERGIVWAAGEGFDVELSALAQWPRMRPPGT
jgi:hypothetical protein